jgi:hypothetical protein
MLPVGIEIVALPYQWTQSGFNGRTAATVLPESSSQLAPGECFVIKFLTSKDLYDEIKCPAFGEVFLRP